MDVKNCVSLLMLLLSMTCACSVQADVAVIANKSVSIGAITAEQAAAIFLSQLDVLEDGTQLIPIDQKETQASREVFYKKIIIFS